MRVAALVSRPVQHRCHVDIGDIRLNYLLALMKARGQTPQLRAQETSEQRRVSPDDGY